MVQQGNCTGQLLWAAEGQFLSVGSFVCAKKLFICHLLICSLWCKGQCVLQKLGGNKKRKLTDRAELSVKVSEGIVFQCGVTFSSF